MIPHLRECLAAQFPANGARSVGTLLLLPVVNSPRMGVCGYTGQAEPPP